MLPYCSMPPKSHSFKNSFVDDCRAKALTCGACQEPYKNPRKITKCDHSFCLECIKDVAKRAIPTCPTCQKTFTMQQLQTNQEINEKLRNLRGSFYADDSSSLDDATSSEKLYDLVSRWPNQIEDYLGVGPAYRSDFRMLLKEVVESFIEGKLPVEECQQIKEVLKKFRKDIEGFDAGKEILGLSQSEWEYLNTALSTLEPELSKEKPNLPEEVLEHVSFNQECLKFISTQAARDYVKDILKKEHQIKPHQCLYLLRPSTRAQGTDMTQKFTLSFVDIDGVPQDVRLGFNSGKWMSYVSKGGVDTIFNSKDSLDEIINTALQNSEREICPIEYQK